MSYFITDIKKLYKSNIVKVMLIILFFIMVVDPVSVYVINARYANFFEQIGSNPFQFWLLMNSSSWGNTMFYTLFWMFPVISTGLCFYNERHTSTHVFLLIRNSRTKYYLSKAAAVFIVTFINFFVLLLINILVTYLIFHVDAPMTEQYKYLIPKEGMFSYSFYQSNPLYMVILYTFLNALAIALLTLFVLAIHEIAIPKKRYVALLVPFILLYLINYVVGLLLSSNLNYNFSVIIQPRAASAVINIINNKDVLLVFSLVLVVDLILLMVGYIRNREVL